MSNRKLVEELGLADRHHREVAPPVTEEEATDEAQSLRRVEDSEDETSHLEGEPIEELDEGHGGDARVQEHDWLLCNDYHMVPVVN